MRFAFSTAPQRTTWDWILDVWRRAEPLEVFESGWTFDHLYPLFGDSTEDCMEGWITLTALLQATERLRGGVLVTGMVYRHPGVLANMASSLDIISGGRLELGIGAGWNTEECDAFGIELGTMTERFDRFEEGLQVLAGLLGPEEHTTFHGEYYDLEAAMNNPKPLQQPLPVCIGGKGPKRTMPLVARFADHWNYSGTDPAEFARLSEVIDAECATIGRDPSGITRSAIARPNQGDDAFTATIESFGDVGANLIIVSLPPTDPPEQVERVAELAAPYAG